MSKIRDIAKILGVTETANSDNKRLLLLGEGGGTDSSTVIQLINQNAVDSDIVTTLATDVANAQIASTVDSSYISDRSGGGGGGGVTSYANTAALPTAAAGNEGSLGYIEDINKLYVSIGTTWAPVSTVNASPTLTVTPQGIIRLSRVGNATTVTLTSTDADSGATLTYSIDTDGNFDGLATISQNNNEFTITPRSQGAATTTSSTVTFSVTDGQAISSADRTFTLNFANADATYVGLNSSSLGLFGAGSATGLVGGQHSAVDRVRGVYVASQPESLDVTNAVTDCGFVGVAKRDVNGNYAYVNNSTFFNPKTNHANGHSAFNAEKYLGAAMATGGYRIFATGGDNTANPPYPYMFKISDSDTPLAEVNPGTSGPASNTRFIKSFGDDYTSGMSTNAQQYMPIACDSSGQHIVVCNPGNSTNQGMAEYIYRDPATDNLTLRQTLVSPGPANNQYYGSSISMQPNGLRMIIGEWGAPGPGTYTGNWGRAMSYVRDSANDTSWTLEDTIQPTLQNLADTENRYTSPYNVPDWAFTTAPRFGQAVAINDDGTVMVAGMPYLYVRNASSNYTYHGGAWICKRTNNQWSCDQLLLWLDWAGWTDPGGDNGKNIGTLAGTSTAQQGVYMGTMVGISPDGNTIVLGAPASGIYEGTSNAVLGTAEHGNLLIWGRDSAGGDYERRNWINGPTSSYSFGRTRHKSYSQGGQFPFLSNTAWAAGRHYNSNTSANSSVYIYDSA